MKTFSANAIAETFERDRGVVVRALRNTKPDAMVSGRPQWKVATASRALESHNRANDGGSTTGTDPELMAVYRAFDMKFDAMVALPTLPQRRAAARKLAPVVAAMDRASRQRGRANGAGDELADLRADQLFRLCMRGFEAPCKWSSTECWQNLDDTADAD
jgi:hypothetical protein